MNEVLRPTQIKSSGTTRSTMAAAIAGAASAAPHTTSSFKSNPSTSTLSTGRSLKSSLKSTNENKISAPAGREIITTSSRRKIYIGRAGAGNAMPTDSTAESQQKVRELLEKERQVLDKYKAQVPAKHTTGRGGAGAKGHVKHKGKAPKDTNSATTTPTTSALTPSQPHSLLRPFKKLHIGKQPDSQDMPSNDILDISASAAATSIPSNHDPERPTEINSHTTAHHYPHYRHATETTSAASAALQMIDPSNRTFIPPSGTVSPPPIPTPVLAIPEKRYSFPYPYTFNIDELRGDDNDTASYVDTASYIDDDRNGDISRRTSGTFGFTNSNVSFISTSPSTPTVPSASPPILPALYFQLPVPPRREDISWAKRRLPVPPVDSHHSPRQRVHV
ncbi:hypothetical protein M408DRAFT_6141 [Serendipita vermifera MAFF 305830]|uniref:Uncharacterized protein n=1 Tax=Serendipita vermifera MAFF 305830 TaxID=933852 RepID=A0A0C2XUT3_SERVB|nr:hypothetical protein M408DRAFT_6141 [Serendipita vermifera MAFF 305830]